MNKLQRWFRHHTAKWERYLMISAAVLLTLLLASQLVMLNMKARSFLSPVESLEGHPYQGLAD